MNIGGNITNTPVNTSKFDILAEQKGALTQWGQPDFDEAYLNQWHPENDNAQLNTNRTIKEVDFIERALKLKPGDTRKILDAPCGHARHVNELTRRGYDVTGFEYSAAFLERGRRDAKKMGINPKLKQGDIRELPFKGEFDIVLNLFTSFGFFEKPEENQATLVQLNQALKQNGTLLIDVADLDFKLKRYDQLGTKGKGGMVSINEKKVMSGIERTAIYTYDPRSQVEHTYREWEENGKKKTYNSWITYYTRPQLEKMLKKAKFTIESSAGDYDWKSPGAETNRIILLARKVSKAS